MKSPQTILTDYLAMRRSLGFKLQKHEPVLREFLRFFATQKASYLTAELALQWADMERPLSSFKIVFFDFFTFFVVTLAGAGGFDDESV